MWGAICGGHQEGQGGEWAGSVQRVVWGGVGCVFLLMLLEGGASCSASPQISVNVTQITKQITQISMQITQVTLIPLYTLLASISLLKKAAMNLTHSARFRGPGSAVTLE